MSTQLTPEAAAEGREVVLVRHAETEWSRDGRHTGRTDIPLTERGRAVARTLAERLPGQPFELVLVSPSRRARETCELCGLAEHARACADLLEWDYGEYEGLTTAEIHARRPDWLLWRDGCPGGESPEQVGARADRVISVLGASRGNAAVFSHGHMLRVLGARWIDLAPEDGGRFGLCAAGVCVLASELRTPILARWNDTGAESL